MCKQSNSVRTQKAKNKIDKKEQMRDIVKNAKKIKNNFMMLTDLTTRSLMFQFAKRKRHVTTAMQIPFAREVRSTMKITQNPFARRRGSTMKCMQILFAR